MYIVGPIFSKVPRNSTTVVSLSSITLKTTNKHLAIDRIVGYYYATPTKKQNWKMCLYPFYQCRCAEALAASDPKLDTTLSRNIRTTYISIFNPNGPYISGQSGITVDHT